MKHLKRILCLSLVLVMALALFTACGPKKKVTADGKVTVGIPGDSTIPDLDTNGYSLWLEKTTGIDVEWVKFASGAANYKQQITLMCSGGETLPEILVGFDGMGHYIANQLGEDGFVKDIKPLIDAGKFPTFQEQLNKLPQKTREYVISKGTNTTEEFGGSFFSLPTVACESIDDQQSMIYINQKWLDKVGMKAPTNIKELGDVCKAFLEQDPNGNGKKDEMPMLDVGNNPEVRNWIINAFVEFNGGCFNVTEDGKVWDPYVTDEFRKALKCVNDFTKKGYYNELGFTLSQSEVKNLLSPVDGSASRVGIFGGHMETSTNSASNILEEFVCLNPLADETGKGGYNIINDVLVSWDAYITKDCADIDEACKVLDAFYLDESVTIQRWGTEGDFWVREEVDNWFGSKSYFKVIDATAFFDKAKNATIGNTLGIMTHQNYMTQAQTKDNSTDKRQIEVTRLIQGQWEIMKGWKKTQVDTLENLVYTTEEYDYRESVVGMFDSYRSEQTVLFMKGEKDINSDKEWNAYKEQIKKLNADKIMKTQQDAYNRKKASQAGE